MRKSIQSLSAKEIDGICDDEILKIVQIYLARNGGEPTARKSIPLDKPLTMSSGIPIRKVRTAVSYSRYTLREAEEDALDDLSERMLSGVGSRFGKDSDEYEKAGGTKKSERKRPVRKPKA